MKLSAMPKITCIDHKDEIVTNFCTQVDCYRPLCPNCINQHILWHKQQDNDIPEIKSFHWVLEQIEGDISKFLEQVEQDQQQIDRQDQNIAKYEKAIKTKIADAHKLAREKVDEYFRQLFATTEAAVRKQREDWDAKKKDVIFKTQQIVKKNLTLKNQLSDANLCIQALYDFIVGTNTQQTAQNADSQLKNLHELNEEFLEDFNRDLDFQAIDVTPDLSKLEELRLNLVRFVSPKNMPIDEYFERNRERIFDRSNYSPRRTRGLDQQLPPAVIYDLNNRSVSPVRTAIAPAPVRIYSPVKAPLQVAPHFPLQQILPPGVYAPSVSYPYQLQPTILQSPQQPSSVSQVNYQQQPQSQAPQYSHYQ